MTVKYKHTSIVLTGSNVGFSDPVDVNEGHGVQFSVVGSYSGQPDFQIRFNTESDSDWRSLTVPQFTPNADNTFENGDYRAAVDQQVRVGLSSHASGEVKLEARVSKLQRTA